MRTNDLAAGAVVGIMTKATPGAPGNRRYYGGGFLYSVRGKRGLSPITCHYLLPPITPHYRSPITEVMIKAAKGHPGNLPRD